MTTVEVATDATRKSRVAASRCRTQLCLVAGLEHGTTIDAPLRILNSPNFLTLPSPNSSPWSTKRRPRRRSTLPSSSESAGWRACGCGPAAGLGSVSCSVVGMMLLWTARRTWRLCRLVFSSSESPTILFSWSRRSDGCAVSAASRADTRYWGKRDTKLILPTNSSLSVTLDQDHLRSTTTSRADASFDKDRLWLNGKEEEIKEGGRLWTCINELRAWRLEEEKKHSKLPQVSPAASQPQAGERVLPSMRERVCGLSVLVVKPPRLSRTHRPLWPCAPQRLFSQARPAPPLAGSCAARIRRANPRSPSSSSTSRRTTTSPPPPASRPRRPASLPSSPPWPPSTSSPRAPPSSRASRARAPAPPAAPSSAAL